MFKIFVTALFIAAFCLLSITAPARAQLEMPKPSEKKGMQSKSYGDPDEVKKLREMVKNNQPGVKEKEDAPPPPPATNGQQETEAEPAPAPETTEQRVWNHYKNIADEEETAEPEQESGESDDDSETAEDEQAESSDSISSLLNQYKNRNKAEMNSRSFATPESIKEDAKPDAAPDTAAQAEKTSKTDKLAAQTKKASKKKELPKKKKKTATNVNSKKDKANPVSGYNN